MTNELYGKDRAGLMERLGRLQGSTTYRGPDSGGGTPFVTRGMTSEAEMLVALKMAQLHPRDVGPWLVYSIALRIDDRRPQIVTWLADKLIAGCGPTGKRNSHRMLHIALASYELAVHGREPRKLPRVKQDDYVLLANVGAGWLWQHCESTVERAERAMRKAEPQRIEDAAA